MSLFLFGCSIKYPPVNLYRLEQFSEKHHAKSTRSLSIIIAQPEAAEGYRSQQMSYVNKPLALNYFVHNAWTSAPAKMLSPLLQQSLQTTGYFHAIVTPPYSGLTDYRLDTQLLELQQNFLYHPSVVQLVVKIVLTRLNNDHVIASKIIKQQVNCPEETPYGGVIAANLAVKAFTGIATDFILKNVEFDQKSRK